MKRTFFQEISRLCEPIRAYPGVSTRLIALATMRGVRAGFIAYILRETTNAYARSPAEGQTRLMIFAGLFICYQLFNRRIQRSDPFRFAMVSMVLKYCHETYLKRFFTLDQNQIEKLGTGKLISLIDKGIGTRADQLNLYILRIPDFGLQLIVGARVASLTHRSYGVGFLGFCIITIAIFWMTHQGGQQRRKRRMELQHERSRTLVRLLMNKIEVLQSHKTQYEITKLKVLEDDIQHINHKKNKTSHGSYVIIAVMVNLLRMIVYLTVGYGLGSGQTTRGDLIVGLTIVSTLDAVMQQMRTLQTGRAFTLDATRQMRDFFDETPLMQSGQSLPLFQFQQGKITLIQLTFGYEGKHVLQDFDLTLAAGKITALVGPSGGGKTTIMKLIAGLLRPDSGTVMIDGQDIHQHDLSSYYSHIGYLIQEPSVFDGTIRENLMYGIGRNGESKRSEENIKRNNIEAIIVEDVNSSDLIISNVLQKAQCHFVYDLSKGLDTEIGERGVRLSGGQRQRLAIAKIMLKDPKIILLDEPTSALDSVSEELVSQAMQELFKNRTVVIIAHRLQTVKHADRILYIDKMTDDESKVTDDSRDMISARPLVKGSAIIEQGTHEELIALDGKYAKMLRVQTSFG